VTFFLLVSLPILLQHSLILWTAIFQSLAQLLNKHVPLKSKIIRTKPLKPWYTQARKKLNLLYAILNASCLVLIHLKILKTCALLLTVIMLHAIITAKQTYNSSLISPGSTNPRQLWKHINILFFIALPYQLYPLMTQGSNLKSKSRSQSKIPCVRLLLTSSLTRFTSSILVYISLVFLLLLTFLLLLLHRTFNPSLVLPLMRFLYSSLSLLTLIVI